MKIITWNCNMAFRKKAAAILAHKPDILIVQECEHPDKLKFDASTPLPKDILWFGNNMHKGLGIFSYGRHTFKLLDTYNPWLRTIAPVAVSGGRSGFLLFAIWANNPEDKGYQYIGQIWKAIHHYDALLKNTRTMLIGDFNSNTIWDKPKREGNHSTVVDRLMKKGIHSTYHHHYKQEQGKEQHPTFYLYKHENKPYHLDYCFVSKDMLGKLASVEVGAHSAWVQYSDHVPVSITFNSK